jgi:hypothetical protein
MKMTLPGSRRSVSPGNGSPRVTAAAIASITKVFPAARVAEEQGRPTEG